MHFLLFLVTMRRSTWFPLSSLVILLIAGIICFVGHCESGKKNLTFVSGILFVLAGKAKYVLYKICINECQAGKVKYSLPKMHLRVPSRKGEICTLPKYNSEGEI